MGAVTGPLADHVFCHLFLAHAADGRLDDEEIMAVRSSVRPAAQRLGYGETDIDEIVIAGIDRYWDTLSEHGPGAVTRMYRDGLARLMAAHNGPGPLLDTLARVAAADGHTDDMEALLIEGVVRRWETLHA